MGHDELSQTETVPGPGSAGAGGEGGAGNTRFGSFQHVNREA